MAHCNPSFIVRPIDRAQAGRLCEAHPHARTLPKSGKFYMALHIGGRVAGLAVWGWGTNPKRTAAHLFGGSFGVANYLELCRFFVYDWCPKNTASKFLATTHRLIKRYAPQVDVLYTYAAGFQGMVGYIYQAAGYDYFGKLPCDGFLYIEGVGLVHYLSLWHRYHQPLGGGRWSPKVWDFVDATFPGGRQWCGCNFRYLYWLCDAARKAELRACSRLLRQPYPKECDLDIYLRDRHGNKEQLSAEFAKSVPIVKLRSTRAISIGSDATANQVDEGGATPTMALNQTAVLHRETAVA